MARWPRGTKTAIAGALVAGAIVIVCLARDFDADDKVDGLVVQLRRLERECSGMPGLFALKGSPSTISDRCIPEELEQASSLSDIQRDIIFTDREIDEASSSWLGGWGGGSAAIVLAVGLLRFWWYFLLRRVAKAAKALRQ